MIPKIIHQVWEGSPLPELCAQLAETWKEHHPDWQYEFWDGDRMEAFVQTHYPQYWDMYSRFPYPVQRWDTIRYLILYQTGGMYVDFDCECLKSADDYLAEEGKCYFSMEPKVHCVEHYNGRETFNNALMASCAGHLFFKKIIEHIFIESQYVYTGNKPCDVMNTTGPVMLSKLYRNCPFKDDIVLWPEELVSPWSKTEAGSVIDGTANIPCLEKKLEKAFAVHYFFSLWV